MPFWRWIRFAALRWSASSFLSSGVRWKTRPSLFFVVPGSKRTSPAIEIDLTPLERQDLAVDSPAGDPNARERALQVFEAAIARGGSTSWFNRMRASINRARQAPNAAAPVATDYATLLIRAFDDQLERLGTTGNRFDRYCQSITDGLQPDTHDRFSEALEKLGAVLGFSASHPRYQAATDCRWRGVFGNQRELVTFEAKIEHLAAQHDCPSRRWTGS